MGSNIQQNYSQMCVESTETVSQYAYDIFIVWFSFTLFTTWITFIVYVVPTHVKALVKCRHKTT